MNRVLTIFAVALTLTAVGCSEPQAVGPDQFKQAVQWTEEYPELVEPFEKSIEDNKLDQEEFESFSGRYHTLVNNAHMDKVRNKLATIKAKTRKDEYAELLAKTRKAAEAQGLVVKETPEGIELVKQEPVPADQINKIAVTSDSNLDPKAIDRAIESALNKPVVVEEDE